MKKIIPFLPLLLVASFIFSCVEDEPIQEPVEVEFPESFSVDIPPSISSSRTGGLNGRLEGDGDGIIEGHDIYQSVPFFINIADESGKIIEFIVVIGKALETYQVTTYNFVSDDDGREKNITINHNVTKGGVDYEYEMLVYDVTDDALALQMLWNTNPVDGVAILQPYNIDRVKNVDAPNAMLKIEYSENDSDYDATMLVSISGLVTVDNGDIDNLKLFAGKKGDIVEVRGNSNHPNVHIIDPNFIGGRNYAFVGRGDEVNNIGVLNLALPPSSVSTEEVFTNYNVHDVLQDEINTVANLDQAIIDEILRETHSPAYFNETEGFITSGVGNEPSGFSSTFIDLSELVPFAPISIRDLEINFED